MAKLTLTEEEAKIPFSQWDDASLGRFVKAAGIVIAQDEGGNRLLIGRAAALWLCLNAHDTNATRFRIELENVTFGEKALGSWVITAERVALPAPAEGL